MYLSELQNKDIISIKNGVNLGRIVDVEINSEGHILGFVAEEKKFFRKVLKNSELNFNFKDIVKIGTDVILVNKWKMWYSKDIKKKSLIIATIIVIIDQVLKIVIDNILSINESIQVIPDIFYITKVYNTGAAWSLFEGSGILLIIIAIVAFFLLLKYQNYFMENKRNILAFALIYGGLVGNLIDRVIYGYVIDYLHIYIFGFSFPVFNLADMAIVIGFLLVIIAIIKGEEHDSSKQRGKWKNR